MEFKKSSYLFPYICFFHAVLYPLCHTDATIHWTKLYWSDLRIKPKQKINPKSGSGLWHNCRNDHLAQCGRGWTTVQEWCLIKIALVGEKHLCNHTCLIQNGWYRRIRCYNFSLGILPISSCSGLRSSAVFMWPHDSLLSVCNSLLFLNHADHLHEWRRTSVELNVSAMCHELPFSWQNKRSGHFLLLLLSSFLQLHCSQLTKLERCVKLLG